MKLNLSIILLILTVFSVISCKTNVRVRVYQFVPSVSFDIHDENEIRKILMNSDTKSIILENDSVLGYFKRYGGLGSYVLVNYKIVNNELITDSLNHDGFDVPDLTSMRFLYSKDSLINKKTNEKYCTQKYLDKKIK